MLGSDGLFDEQIANNLGIAYSTFREYVKKYPALSAALKRSKEVIDYEVENALLKRALGYEFEEQTYISVEIDQDEYDLKVELELEIWNAKNQNATQAELISSSFPYLRQRRFLRRKSRSK